MTVYLLHLDQPLSRGVSPNGTPLKAGHYIGYAEDLIERIDEHASVMWKPLDEPETTDDGRKVLGVKHGNGSRFMGVVNYHGVNWRLARVWEGDSADRSFERQLKNRKKAPLLCPICNPNAMRLAKLPEPEPKPRRRVRRSAPVMAAAAAD